MFIKYNNRFLLYISMISLIIMVGACQKNDDSQNPTMVIEDFFPKNAFKGDTITILGKGFPENNPNLVVKLGTQSGKNTPKAINLEILSVSSQQIKVRLPEEVEKEGVLRVILGDKQAVSQEVLIAGRIVLKGDIVSNTTLYELESVTKKPNKYLLVGEVRVASGVVLAIEPGTIIFGDKPSGGRLLLLPGAVINAQGTSEKPIVFTSARPPGLREPGDWGGIILAGQPNLNSGVFKYVRIEFAGLSLTPGSRENALTLKDLGNNTNIEYIQVSYAAEDSFEWQAGNVNAKYLVSLGAADDDLSFRRIPTVNPNVFLGHSGFIQFVLALRDPYLSDLSQSNGIEAEGEQTIGVVSNFTYIGAEQLIRNIGNEQGVPFSTLHGRGAHLKLRSRISIVNSLFVGANLAGISLDAGANFTVPAEAPLSYLNSTGALAIELSNNIIIGSIPASYPITGGPFGIEVLKAGIPSFMEPGNEGQNNLLLGNIINKFTTNNTIDQGEPSLPILERTNDLLNKWGLREVVKYANITKPVPMPLSDSPLLENGVFVGKTFSTQLNNLIKFRGAFGDLNRDGQFNDQDNWTKGWANFNPQFTNY